MDGVSDTASYFTLAAQKEKKKLDKTLPGGGRFKVSSFYGGFK